MPINPYNPVLRGIETGYGIADRIRQAALQEQEYQRRVREDAFQQENQKFMQQRQQKADALDELKMRLGLATSPELQEIPAGANNYTAEARMPESAQPAAGSGAARIMQSMTGPNYTLPVQMPVENALEYGGQRYVVRTPEELSGQRMREAEQQGTFEANQKAREARQLLEATGVRVPTSIAESLGLSPDTLVPPTALGGLARAAQPANPPAQIPGRDVPYPPAVEAQRSRMAAARPPAAGSASAQDVKDTAQAIAEGTATPVLTSYSFRDRTAIAGELKRRGYNQMEAQRDFQAVNKHLTTLNGAQQLRLRQAVTFAYDHLEVVDNLYKQWAKKVKDLGGTLAMKGLNKATLAISAQSPGELGALAQNLQAQINDFTSEMGTVYKGGNSSTDETLRLAAGNLKADWNEQTWNKAIGLLRTSLTIRKNSISTTEAAGVTPGSPYNPAVPPKEALPTQGGSSRIKILKVE